MSNRILLTALLVTALAQLSCGGGGFGSTTTLTQNQAEALAEVLGESLGDADLEGSGKIAGKFLPSFDVGTATFSASRDCENAGEGTVAVEGTATVTESSATRVAATVTHTVTLTNCEIHTDDGDILFGEGEVTTTSTFDINPEDEEGTITASFGGIVGVTGDDVEAGDCGINLNISAIFSATMLTLTGSGDICTTNISSSGTVSLAKSH